MRVVRGLHGFHLYANEHWVTYLLDAIKTSFNTIDETPLYSLARSLAVAANENEEHLLEKDGKIINDLDEVVKHIPDIQLQQLVRVTIASRSAKSLEQQLLLPNGKFSLSTVSLAFLLTILQMKIRTPRRKSIWCPGPHCKSLSRLIRILSTFFSRSTTTQVYHLKSFKDSSISFATLLLLADSATVLMLPSGLNQRSPGTITNYLTANQLCALLQIANIHHLLH